MRSLRRFISGSYDLALVLLGIVILVLAVFSLGGCACFRSMMNESDPAALQSAGAAIGGLVGGPPGVVIGASIATAVGSVLGSRGYAKTKGDLAQEQARAERYKGREEGWDAAVNELGIK